MTDNKMRTFSTKIISWQKEFGRNRLPWSVAGWGYGVWVSEIMLQQTQVCTVLPRFQTFIARFPTVNVLARARLDDVLAEWSGLGYYARAKNLHHSAKIILNEYAGIFPTDFKNLLALPGVGRSTAGAILSLAFSQAHPILDGNVKRIFKRYFRQNWPEEPTDKELWALATKILPEHSDQMRRYNQGLMDLGAGVCTFRRPDCHSCPLQSQCDSAFDQSIVPAVKKTGTARKKIRIVASILIEEDKVYLEKVPESLKIWQGLYFFPITFNNTIHSNSESKIFSDQHEPSRIRHLCSHIELEVEAFNIDNKRLKPFVEKRELQKHFGKWYSLEELKKIGLPSLFFKLLEKSQDLNSSGSKDQQRGKTDATCPMQTIE